MRDTGSYVKKKVENDDRAKKSGRVTARALPDKTQTIIEKSFLFSYDNKCGDRLGYIKRLQTKEGKSRLRLYKIKAPQHS